MYIDVLECRRIPTNEIIVLKESLIRCATHLSPSHYGPLIPILQIESRQDIEIGHKHLTSHKTYLSLLGIRSPCNNILHCTWGQAYEDFDRRVLLNYYYLYLLKDKGLQLGFYSVEHKVKSVISLHRSSLVQTTSF